MDAFMDTLFNPHTAYLISKYATLIIVGLVIIGAASRLWHSL